MMLYLGIALVAAGFVLRVRIEWLRQQEKIAWMAERKRAGIAESVRAARAAERERAA